MQFPKFYWDQKKKVFNNLRRILLCAAVVAEYCFLSSDKISETKHIL